MHASLVFLHILGGSVAILSGAVALTVRKGDTAHRMSGTVFFLAMLMMTAIAAPLAALKPDRLSLVGAIWTFYLVATAWLTVRREDGRIGLAETLLPYLALAATAGAIVFGLQAWQARPAPFDGYGSGVHVMFAVFGGLALFSALLDFRVISNGGVAGTHRIARHVWRMCTGTFMATGSFFLGQQKVMPVFMKGSPTLLALALAPFVAMIFWLLVVYATRRFRSAAVAA